MMIDGTLIDAPLPLTAHAVLWLAPPSPYRDTSMAARRRAARQLVCVRALRQTGVCALSLRHPVRPSPKTPPPQHQHQGMTSRRPLRRRGHLMGGEVGMAGMVRRVCREQKVRLLSRSLPRRRDICVRFEESELESCVFETVVL